MTSALLWGGAAACFLGAFVGFMMEPVNRRGGAPAAKDAKAAQGCDEPAEPADASASAPGPALRRRDGAPRPSPTSGDTPRRPSEAAPPPSSPPLLRRGNPLRWLRGGVTALVASFFALLLMAHAGQLRWGVPARGAASSRSPRWGVMDLLGTFDDADDRVASVDTRSRQLAAPLVGFVVACARSSASRSALAHAGRGLPQIGWGIVVTLAFVAASSRLFELGRALGAVADGRGRRRAPALEAPRLLGRRRRRALLYFPCIGSYSLWDPWETHYGEVAREILARDDWISPLVGAGRLVLVASRSSTSGSRRSRWRRSASTTSPTRCSSATGRRAACAPRVGGARAGRPADDRRALPPLQGRREGLRAPRRPPRRRSSSRRCPTGSSSRTRR